MKLLRLPASLVAALALATVTAATALAAQTTTTKTFKATYTGTATERVSGQTVNALAKGAGLANLLGKSTITGNVVADTSSATQTGCAPFNGPGSIKSAKGILKVKVLPSSKGCAVSQEEQDNITLSGNVQVKGGTKAFKKAKGNLHFSGKYDRKNGAFTVKLTGTLSY